MCLFCFFFKFLSIIIQEIIKSEKEKEAMQDKLKGSEKRTSLLNTDLKRLIIEQEQLIEELSKNEQNKAALDETKVSSENELEEVRRSIEKIKGMFFYYVKNY